ncbi:hypothetical protein ACTXL6_11750 [Brachybacterium tyrofermentans]|uniref:hypothetical protein n=1 Tax=Brachybacterium tyrofermentans TaxID=47848 RepID=UPI003FD3CB9D
MATDDPKKFPDEQQIEFPDRERSVSERDDKESAPPTPAPNSAYSNIEDVVGGNGTADDLPDPPKP